MSKKKKKKVERLALVMARTLSGYMMPHAHFDEPEDPWAGDHDSAFGSRRGDGTPIMSLTEGMTLGEARVRRYLEERARSRQLYVTLAEKIVDRVEEIKAERRSKCHSQLDLEVGG